jgi:translocation and assembly module TamB
LSAAPASLRRRVWIGAGALTLVSAAAIALGPGAAPLVDALADGQKVWRLGRLQIDGVRGAWIGDLSARTITLSDADGVWAHAEHARLRWSPQALFFGRIDIAAAQLGVVTIERTPALSAPRPPGGVSFDVTLQDAIAPRIIVREAAFGRAGEAALRLALSTRDDALTTLSLSLRRLDADTDRLTARYDSNAEAMLEATLDAAADGVFAAALDTPAGAAITARALVTRTGENGAGAFTARIGDASALDGALTWTAASWSANAALAPGLIGAAAPLVERLGPDWRIAAQGRRDVEPAPVAVTFASQTLRVAANGALGAGGDPAAPWQIEAQTENLARLAQTTQGAARIDGTLQIGDGRTRFDGRAHLRDIAVLDDRLAFDGPLRVRLDARTLDVDLEAQTAAAAQTSRAHALTRNGRIEAALLYDRQTQTLQVRRARYASAALALDGEGRLDADSGALGGRWRLIDARALGDLAGAAAGRWGFTRTPGASWLATLQGQGDGVRGAGLAPTLLGPSPRVSAEARVQNGAVAITRATLDGARLRVGGAGTIANGGVSATLEASARGPIALGAATLDGVIDATGRIVGPLARPRVEAEARWAQLDAGGVTITQPALRVTYDMAQQAGSVDLDGAALGQDLRARADLAVDGARVLARNIAVQGERLSAQGDLAFSAAGIDGAVRAEADLAGVDPRYDGAVQASLTLTAPDGVQRLAARAAIERARFGVIRLARVTLDADGPLDAIAVQARARGAAGEAPLDLAMTGAITQTEAGALAELAIDGAVDRVRLATRTPARIVIGADGLEAQAALISGDGAADILWRDARDRFELSATIRDAELQPLAALAGVRALGSASGSLALRSAGAGLEGEADFATQGFRMPARMRNAVDLSIAARLRANRLTARAAAQSRDGLDAVIEGEAPVLTGVRPVRIGMAPIGEGRAAWRVAGPADALWSLIGGLDQSLEGAMSGAGAVRFSANRLSGDGELRITQGRFEDKRAGLTLQNVDARLSFDEDGRSRFDITAEDGDGGRVTGSGAARGLQDGRIDLNLRRIRLLDRAEARATASGPLALQWTRTGATLSGALTLDSADLRLTTSAAAQIPQLDVIEINAPGGDLPAPAPRAPAMRTRLDLSITAPARMFTRGRGVNAEWSLDARVSGDAAAPRLTGEARLIRGDFDLAGRRFDLTEGRITLDGDPSDAAIDITAERETDAFTAIAALSGRIGDPTLTLSSNPALPEDEVLPQVLFGRNAEDLTAFEAAQLAASLAALTGSAALDFASLARSAVGLDRLQVGEDANGVIVTGGRYLTRDVYLEIARSSLGQASTRVEWRVRPKLSLITSFLPNGDGRASIRWRREY